MWKKLILLTIVIVPVLYYILKSSDKNTIDRMVYYIVNRGILTPNCKNWKISENNLKDASGVKYYNSLISEKGITPITMLNRKITLLTGLKDIKNVLYSSPDPYGPGDLKVKMFSSFMPENVGISTGENWRYRRNLNEYVIDNIVNLPYFTFFISNLALQKPINFKDFEYLGKKLAMKFVFGDEKIVSEIFELFGDANSYSSLTYPDYSIPENIMKPYLKYLREKIDSPVYPSMVWFAVKSGASEYEILNQIPHWIFPIVGLISTSSPRLLLTGKTKIDRNDILELLRLNNPVVTTFRKKDNKEFLMLNNGVLRDFRYWGKDSNSYKPERWENLTENEDYVVQFNQGPQKCPGKELSLWIIETFTNSYLSNFRIIEKYPKIDLDNFPQMINPCSISFRLEK